MLPFSAGRTGMLRFCWAVPAQHVLHRLAHASCSHAVSVGAASYSRYEQLQLCRLSGSPGNADLDGGRLAAAIPAVDLMAKREEFEALVHHKLLSYGGSCLLSDLLSDPNVKVAAKPLLAHKTELCLLQQMMEVKLLPLKQQQQQPEAGDSVVALSHMHEDCIPLGLMEGVPRAQIPEESAPEQAADTSRTVLTPDTTLHNKQSPLKRLLGMVWDKAN